MTIQTSLRYQQIIPDLKPSMAFAPKVRKKKPVVQKPNARAGVDYEVYKPSIHSK
jgi:hypothetical protein